MEVKWLVIAQSEGIISTEAILEIEFYKSEMLTEMQVENPDNATTTNK